MTTGFCDRTEAGCRLAEQLQPYAERPDVIILALPRGGVPIGFEIAKTLHVSLDVCLVRKLGVPNHRELAMGAIASNGVRVLNEGVVRGHHVSKLALQKVTIAELHELQRRDRAYRGDRPFPDLNGKTVILVDDGLATGATMRAAIAIVKQQHPAAVVVAVPLAPPDTCDTLRQEVNELVCLVTPDPFYSLGTWYDHFEQLSDGDVQHLLEMATTFLP
jgi:putative phosphoribosyl transferase